MDKGGRPKPYLLFPSQPTISYAEDHEQEWPASTDIPQLPKYAQEHQRWRRSAPHALPVSASILKKACSTDLLTLRIFLFI